MAGAVLCFPIKYSPFQKSPSARAPILGGKRPVRRQRRFLIDCKLHTNGWLLFCCCFCGCLFTTPLLQQSLGCVTCSPKITLSAGCGLSNGITIVTFPLRPASSSLVCNQIKWVCLQSIRHRRHRLKSLLLLWSWYKVWRYKTLKVHNY